MNTKLTLRMDETVISKAKGEARRRGKSVSKMVVWPNGADLCPDVLIWGGPPPAEASSDKPESALR